MATLTGKASVIRDCQMPPSLRPNFCRALEHHDYLSAPTTLRVVWRLPQARFLQQARRQSWAEAAAASSLEPHLCPSQRAVARLH